MKELICPYRDILQILGNPVSGLKDFLPSESKKYLYERFTRDITMSEEIFNTEKDGAVGEELAYFNTILKQHDQGQCTNMDEKPTSEYSCSKTADIPSVIDYLQPIASPEAQTLLDSLHDKKVNLVLVATSLDENDVVRKLENTLDPTKSKMIPLTFDDNTKGISDEGDLHGSHRSSTETYEGNNQTNDVKKIGPTRKKSGKEKDKGYWKRRTSNNEAAKKSRDARKARLEWMENRTKELEVENESLKKQLENLTQEVLDKQKML